MSFQYLLVHLSSQHGLKYTCTLTPILGFSVIGIVFQRDWEWYFCEGRMQIARYKDVPINIRVPRHEWKDNTGSITDTFQILVLNEFDCIAIWSNLIDFVDQRNWNWFGSMLYQHAKHINRVVMKRIRYKRTGYEFATFIGGTQTRVDPNIWNVPLVLTHLDIP